MIHRQIIKIAFLFVLGITLAACQLKQKYYYVEGDKEAVIKACTDSAAYLEAYKNYIISLKVENDMRTAFGGNYSPKNISFRLYNSRRDEITNISFSDKERLMDSITQKINKLPDEITKSVNKSREEKHGVGAKYDTGGLYLSPVKVISAKFEKGEYSNYRNVTLRYKNVSDKIVTGIRFKWYGENAFNEPADMSGVIRGWGGGFTDDVLRPGATDYGEWRVLSRDGKKILIAYPYEVAFKDGSKWELSE